MKKRLVNGMGWPLIISTPCAWRCFAKASKLSTWKQICRLDTALLACCSVLIWIWIFPSTYDAPLLVCRSFGLVISVNPKTQFYFAFQHNLI
jgi:hypothetical protein